MKPILLYFLLIISIRFNAQPTNSPYRKEKPVHCIDYKDKYANGIFLCEDEKYPSGVDSNFFKNNITGLNFLPNILESEKRYAFFIRKVKYVKKQNKYELAVMIYRFPFEEGKGGRWGEWRYYLMSIKKAEDKKMIVDTLVFDHL